MPRAHADVTSLISSRICHDLVSPLGALANGLELLELSGLPDSPELMLMRDSLQNGMARIEFFRVAFGPASEQEDIGASKLQEILTNYFADTRMSAYWLNPVPVPRKLAKLLLLLVQCVERAMPFGGEIRIDYASGSWRLHAEGRECRPDMALWDSLKSQTQVAEVTSAEVHFELARRQAVALGASVEFTHSSNAMTVRVVENDL